MKLSPKGIEGIRRDIQDLTEYSWERTRFEKLLDHTAEQDTELELYRKLQAAGETALDNSVAVTISNPTT